jgi:catechol 2,3-dioxygenase-like lactoylglutathione lyase family enzyme
MLKQGVVTLMVFDMKKAIHFYTEVLGFDKGPIYGNEWAEIRAPGFNIGLHPQRKDAKPPLKEGHLSLGFVVEDLDEATDALKGKGVEFSFMDDEAGRFAFFKDPDKTPLYLIEPKLY